MMGFVTRNFGKKISTMKKILRLLLRNTTFFVHLHPALIFFLGERNI